jgi:hypothetical protein
VLGTIPLHMHPDGNRRMFLLVDNPPTSAKNIVWLDPAPEIKWNLDQAGSALRIGDRCEAAR